MNSFPSFSLAFFLGLGGGSPPYLVSIGPLNTRTTWPFSINSC